MKKTLLTIGMATLLAITCVLPVKAADSTVEFKSSGELSTPADLGDTFKGVAPGEKKSLTVDIENNNSHTTDFYLSAEVLKALEEAGGAGAGYDVTLEAGGTVLYSSALGGYTSAGIASTQGLGEMSESLSDSILIATLNKGGKTSVVLTIGLDGEGMDKAGYAKALGAVELEFMAAYEDATGPYTVYKVVTKTGEQKYVTIYDNETPRAAKTGDNFSVLLASVVLAVGVACFVVGVRRKAGRK